MGKITSFADLIGIIKDKVSQSKAVLVSSNPKNKTISFHLSVLRATTHDPSTPPGNRHLTVLLSAGTGSRATAASAVEAIMDRLHTTKDACVALKSLIIVHHIVKHGRFILQDQLSVYPATGGRNYLKLSSFRDEKSPLMWELSSWVRWYGVYLEHLLTTSRIMGFFISSTSNTIQKEEYEEMVSSLTNSDLLREIDALVGLLEEACKIPELPFSGGRRSLADKIIRLVGEDYVSSINELYVRINEFKERSCNKNLSFGDSIELVCGLKRLESCKDRLSEICHGIWKKAWIDGFWSLVLEVKGMIGDLDDNSYGQIVGIGRREKGYESARFTDRFVIGYSDAVRFSSGRFCNVDDRFSYPVSSTTRTFC